MPLREGRAVPWSGRLPPAPPGWVAERDRYVEDTSVGGYAVRRVQATARCQREDCRRRVEVDFAALIRLGFGAVQWHHVRGLYECRRPAGCGLAWQPDLYPHGVPLAVLLKPESGVSAIAVTCDGCARTTRYPVLTLIDRLTRSRAADAGTGLLELPAKIRGACRGCGARRWSCAAVRGAGCSPV